MASLASAEHAQAATLFDSGGFEAPGYVAGQFLTGNTGTAVPKFMENASGGTTGDAPDEQVATYAGAFGPPNSTTQQLAVLDAFGLNSSGIDSGAVASDYVPTPYTPTAATGQIVNIRFSMSDYEFQGQPEFGVEAFSTTGRPLAELLVNAGTNTITDGTDVIASPLTLGAGNFYQYQLQLNYATNQASIYQVGLGATAFGTPLATTSFTGTTFGYSALTVASLSGGAAGGLSAAGDGYVDNYTITTAAAVPEPTTASLAVAGVAALAAGRRRRRQPSGR